MARQREMVTARVRLLRDRSAIGAAERLPGDSLGIDTVKAAHAEQEVILGCVGSAAYALRVEWGDDPEYDEIRLDVCQKKSAAIEELRKCFAAK